MIPAITHLQFLVLTSLLEGEQSGRFVRDTLKELGEPKSRPAFYQIMARLEDASLVSGRYDQKVIDGNPVRVRKYRITTSGVKACAWTCEFYQSMRSTK